MPELSPDAKRELQEAIRIVREDKQFTMLREIHARGNTPPPPPDPTGNPPTGGPTGGPTPPPPNPPDSNQPPPNPPKKDAYWGELLS